MKNDSFVIGLYSSCFSPERESKTHSYKSLINTITRMGHSYRVLIPSKFALSVSSSCVDLIYDNKDIAIDGMIIRGTSGAKIPTSLLANSLWYKNIPTVDKRQAFSGQYMTKFGALLRRYSQLKQYIPHTFLLYTKENTLDMIKTGKITPPVIRKPLQGTRGIGVFILNTSGELASFIENYDFREPLMLQRYIRDAQEFRSIVVNHNCIGVVKKIPNQNGIGNFAQGAVFIKPDRDPESLIKKISVDISNKSPYDILGIDILIDKDNRIYIIEANRNPQFKGFETVYPDSDIAHSIIKLLIDRIVESKNKAG